MLTMTHEDEDLGNTAALLDLLQPGGSHVDATQAGAHAVRVAAAMDRVNLSLDQRLEVLKVLHLQAIEGHLAGLARRSQLMLEQLVASHATRAE